MALYQNPYNVHATPLDMEAPGALPEKTYRSYDIVINGKVVARVQNMSEDAYNRNSELVYELRSDTFGLPVSRTIGNLDGFQLTLSRVELWHEEFSRVVGQKGQWENQAEQDAPFTVIEILRKGTEIYEVWAYRGCWVLNYGRQQFDAQGNPNILYDLTIGFVRKEKIIDASAEGNLTGRPSI